jgi:hypothetical protein
MSSFSGRLIREYIQGGPRTDMLAIGSDIDKLVHLIEDEKSNLTSDAPIVSEPA